MNNTRRGDSGISWGVFWAGVGALATVGALIVSIIQLDTGAEPAPPAPASPLHADPPPTVTVTEPLPALSTVTTPSPPNIPGDLKLSVAPQYPPCDGRLVIIVSSAVNPASYRSDVQEGLDNFPGSSYLRTDSSCPSLRARTTEGHAIFAVYYSSDEALPAVCHRRADVGGDAYVRRMDMTTPPGVDPC